MQNALRGLVRPSSNARQVLVGASPSFGRRAPCCVHFSLGSDQRARWCCASRSSHQATPASRACYVSALSRTPATATTSCHTYPKAQQVRQRRGLPNATQRHFCIASQTRGAEQSTGPAPAEAEAQQEDSDDLLSDDLDDLSEEEMQQMLEDDDQPTDATSQQTANTEWGSKGLAVAEQVLQRPSMQELALYSFITSPTGKQLKIRLDKPSDEYGSPSLDELSEFSRAFADEYSIALGAAADEVAVEVSSPGAERQVRLPQDLLRFQHIPMSVVFQLEDSERIDTKVMDLVSLDEQSGITEWKLSDVKQNRTGKGTSKLSRKQAEQRFKKPLSLLQRVNLHLEL